MGKFVFKLPDIGEGIAEAEIVAWHVAVGDRIEEDQPLADMMTDKATVEMESPVAGIVTAVAGEAGDVIAIGSMLVEIQTETEGDAADEARDYGKAEPEAVAAPEPSPPPQMQPAKNMADVVPVQSNAVVEPETMQKITASPAVRARARDLGVDLNDVKASGGHIRHADLDAYLNYGAGQGYRAPGGSAKRVDETIKVIGMRRRIAENMAASKRHIPHFSYVEEFDVTAVEGMRADLNANRGNRPKLTMLPFLIVAICKALPDFPMINARYDDEAGMVTRHGSVHLGMAT
ncbi:MAG: dihydrolipoamide acetyltransferase family protein, partial [Bacteroidota bacterium]